MKNNTGWIHVSQLTKKKAAITIYDDILVFNSPTVYSKPIVKLKKGKLILISKCKKIGVKLKYKNLKVGSKRIVYGGD